MEIAVYDDVPALANKGVGVAGSEVLPVIAMVIAPWCVPALMAANAAFNAV
jgi:hypothetical protein